MNIEASDSTLTTYTASDGDNIAVQEWPLPSEQAARGVVLVVHGLGEHAGRYGALARRLNDWGFIVRGYDQYGHGESGGVRGALPKPGRLLDDLADIVDTTRGRMPKGMPLLLLGHSMGGLVAASFVAMRDIGVDGLVLSSPALDPGLGAVQKLLLALMLRIAPNVGVSNGLDADFLSHDRAVVAAYRADPLVHDRITAKLAHFIASAGAPVLARTPQWRVPTLLLYAGADRLVDPAGSRSFAAAAPPAVVTAQCFPEHFHEIFNELDAEPVYDALRQWLDARF